MDQDCAAVSFIPCAIPVEAIRCSGSWFACTVALVLTRLHRVQIIFFRPTPSWLPPGRSTCLKACCNGINYLTKACVGRSCRVAAKVTGGGPIHSPICCHDHPENKPKQSKQKHKQKPPQTKNKQKQTKQKPKRTPGNDVTATSCG